MINRKEARKLSDKTAIDRIPNNIIEEIRAAAEKGDLQVEICVKLDSIGEVNQIMRGLHLLHFDVKVDERYRSLVIEW